MSNDELIKKYGDIEVSFTSYYKYSFAFKSADGKYEITVGGDSSDIYKFDVDTRPVKLRDLVGYGYLYLTTPDGDFDGYSY